MVQKYFFFQIFKCVKENPFQSKIKTFQKQFVKNSPIYSPSPVFVHWKCPCENIEVVSFFFLFFFLMVYSRKQMYNPFIDSPFGKSHSVYAMCPLCVCFLTLQSGSLPRMCQECLQRNRPRLYCATQLDPSFVRRSWMMAQWSLS